MSFETISLLLNWMEMGALLAILFRLSSTFNLIANTQRELRRAIYHQLMRISGNVWWRFLGLGPSPRAVSNGRGLF